MARAALNTQRQHARRYRLTVTLPPDFATTHPNQSVVRVEWATAAADFEQTEINGTGIPPTDDRESAILGVLNGGNYTAIVRGKNGSVGAGLGEAHRLNVP